MNTILLSKDMKDIQHIIHNNDHIELNNTQNLVDMTILYINIENTYNMLICLWIYYDYTIYTYNHIHMSELFQHLELSNRMMQAATPAIVLASSCHSRENGGEMALKKQSQLSVVPKLVSVKSWYMLKNVT